eukprot:7305591-Prymnesium_polylepis.1
MEASWAASRAHDALACDGTAVAVLGLPRSWASGACVHGAEDGFNRPQPPVLTAHENMGGWAIFGAFGACG